jgi:predicted NUDIX family NTP pyrophosphohydrolase
MGARSAGLLAYRVSGKGALEVLIAHPGGPFWVRKDEGAWSVPKGEYQDGDDALSAAYREFTEETGLAPPAPPAAAVPLGELRQAGGKLVSVWAVEGDLDVAKAVSNTFEMEWPRGSGRMQEFPEVDRVEWMSLEQARVKLLKSQTPFLDTLETELAARGVAVREER